MKMKVHENHDGQNWSTNPNGEDICPNPSLLIGEDENEKGTFRKR